MYFLILQR